MLYTTFQILGSLGIFLFGMRLMSESIQKYSGERLRTIMGSMTGNRFAGITTGFLITCLVQSSSATTVLVVSFVHAQLLTLVQSIGVIMGANLGTTTTFWIISFLGFKFSLSKIAIPIIGIGVILSFFKFSKLKEFGNFLTGFGLLFFGLSLLKNAVPDIKSNPEALEWIASLSGHGFSSILLFMLFGVVLTIVVQSSSVAGAITLTMAYKGWIDYHNAAAIILGENIGTTVTAYLASLTANTAAKRAARAHFMFNVIGVIWMLAFFYPFVNLVDFIMPGNPADADALPMHMALFHTLFNMLNILVLVGFVPQIGRLVEWMVKEKDQTKSSDIAHYNYISSYGLAAGELNFEEARQALLKLGDLSKRMFNKFIYIYNRPDEDLSREVKELDKMEDESNEITREVTDYLIRCSNDQVSERTRSTASSYLRVLAELEEVCDCCHRLTTRAAYRYKKDREISKELENDVIQFGDIVNRFIDFYQSKLGDSVSVEDMGVAFELEKMINDTRKRLRKRSVNRMMANSSEVKSELIYFDIVNTFERIGNHCRNIIQSLPQTQQ